MIKISDWGLVAIALRREIDRWPLGTWATVHDLMDASPEIEELGDGKYVVSEVEIKLADDAFDRIEMDIEGYARGKGFFVDWDFDKGISLHEYVDAAREFDFDEIESFSLTYEPALLPGGQSGARYDGETLEVAPDMPEVAGFPRKSVQMDAGRKERLRNLIEETGVRLWVRDYHPVGYTVLDGWGWKLTIRFKSGKVFASEGSNAWPVAMGPFWEGLFDIVGLEVPSGNDRPMWVCELVGEDLEG